MYKMLYAGIPCNNPSAAKWGICVLVWPYFSPSLLPGQITVPPANAVCKCSRTNNFCGPDIENGNRPRASPSGR